MNLQALQCPHCGAVLNVTDSTRVAHCEFCGTDIMVEQSRNQNIPPQQYMERELPPEFVTRNDLPPQPYQNQEMNLRQNHPGYYLPVGMADENALRWWKTKFKCCHIALFLSVFIWLIMVIKDSHSNPALFPFLIGLCIFMAAPIILAATKPNESDFRKNHKGWNILKYYLLFSGNVVISFVFTAIICMIFGIE